MNSKVNKSLNEHYDYAPSGAESCRSGKTCKYGRWACIGVLWQNGCPHIKHEAVFNTNHALATAEDTRHCFHRVVNLTIIHMSAAHKYMGRTSEGGECWRTSSDPILCVHSLPLSVMWPAQWAQEARTLLNSPCHDRSCLGRLQVLLRNVHAAYREKTGKWHSLTAHMWHVNCHSRTTCSVCANSVSPGHLHTRTTIYTSHLPQASFLYTVNVPRKDSLVPTVWACAEDTLFSVRRSMTHSMHA